MTLLLTILSVLAVWALLAALVVGLLLILKPLESVRKYLEEIAMGVRAIEKETMPLGPHAKAFAASLGEAAETGDALAQRMADVDRNLDAALPAMDTRSTNR